MLHVSKTSVVEVWVERFDPTLGEDFGWQREPRAIVRSSLDEIRPGPLQPGPLRITQTRARELVRHREFEALIDENLIDQVYINPPLWHGTVTLPEAVTGDKRFRLVIAEYEEYLVDGDDPYETLPWKKDRRLVFVEHVELD